MSLFILHRQRFHKTTYLHIYLLAARYQEMRKRMEAINTQVKAHEEKLAEWPVAATEPGKSQESTPLNVVVYIYIYISSLSGTFERAKHHNFGSHKEVVDRRRNHQNELISPKECSFHAYSQLLCHTLTRCCGCWCSNSRSFPREAIFLGPQAKRLQFAGPGELRTHAAG